MIRRSDGKILALHKVSQEYSGVTFPGGHIEPGESLTDAVFREVHEETGLSIRSVHLCGIYDWPLGANGRYVVFLYECSDFTGSLHPSEEGSLEWVTQEDFLCLPLAQGMVTVLQIMNDAYIDECFYEPQKGTEHLYGSNLDT